MAPPRDGRVVGTHLDASRVDMAQTLATGLLQAAVRGGATRQVAAAVAAALLRTAYEVADGPNSKVAPDLGEVDELLRFPEELKALVGAATGKPPATGGRAIHAAVQAGLPTQLANEARSLIRSRAAKAHPLPKGKCKEVLNKLRNGLLVVPIVSQMTSDETSTTDAFATDYEDIVAPVLTEDKCPVNADEDESVALALVLAGARPQRVRARGALLSSTQADTLSDGAAIELPTHVLKTGNMGPRKQQFSHSTALASQQNTRGARRRRRDCRAQGRIVHHQGHHYGVLARYA